MTREAEIIGELKKRLADLAPKKWGQPPDSIKNMGVVPMLFRVMISEGSYTEIAKCWFQGEKRD